MYNRGVEKRTTFQNTRDYEKFLYLAFACNDTKPLVNSQFYYRGLTSIAKVERKGERLVDLLGFCLMPNHYHFLLRQLLEGGISVFMQKIGTGYTMYFNMKYARVGSLFQGTFRAVHVKNEEHLTHLSRYIHLNAAELREPDWKTAGIRNLEDTHEFVKRYPWSSYGDYLGGKRFSSLLNPDLFTVLYETPAAYEEFVKSWLVRDLDSIADLTIEV